MTIAVTGSIATDQLMTFPGRFADVLLAEQLDHLSVSFLVDELQLRRGGVAANICFGMAELGVRSLLVGAVGSDFADYRQWLDEHGVDTSQVLVSTERHTPRFICTTDQDMNQIASFYAGAMTEAARIRLAEVADRVGPLDLVVVAANDPTAMLRHTRECRELGIPFAADPSQQLARMDGAEIRDLIDGARYLLTNEYESALTERKTGWSAAEILARVEVRVTTHGARGVRLDRRDHAPVHVPAAPTENLVEPTGTGDAFRAGFLAALSWGCGLERSAQVGCLIATMCLETVGTQEYQVDPAGFVDRFACAYGSAAAAEVSGHLQPA